jgi:hypothetical protein
MRLRPQRMVNIHPGMLTMATIRPRMATKGTIRPRMGTNPPRAPCVCEPVGSFTYSAAVSSELATRGIFLRRRIEPYLLEPCRRRRAVFDPTPAHACAMLFGTNPALRA